jgi:hypothetical protein
MTKPTAPPYLLRHNVYAALVDGIFVFLDVAADRYSCLERRHTAMVARALGLQVILAPGGTSATGVEMASILTDLEANGILTREPELGRPARLMEKPVALREVYAATVETPRRIGPLDVARFAKALLITKLLRRWAPFQWTVARVARRRAARAHRAVIDETRITEVIELYRSLKPLAVTVRDECLFNALLCIEFFASYGIYPSWHFGVRLNPFYAHCWVQAGDRVYDDFADTVGQNQPIMTV